MSTTQVLMFLCLTISQTLWGAPVNDIMNLGERNGGNGLLLGDSFPELFDYGSL
uniref:Uncharacterized protein n=1 Tax=Anguilla anguilla TaxID=7936 RepID=A0A0E9Q0X5_ANGAN